MKARNRKQDIFLFSLPTERRLIDEMRSSMFDWFRHIMTLVQRRQMREAILWGGGQYSNSNSNKSMLAFSKSALEDDHNSQLIPAGPPPPSSSPPPRD